MNQPLVTIITPTGHRPKALALCEQYVRWQTYPKNKIHWIVVHDDGFQTKEPQDINQFTLHVNGPLIWKAGYNTQRLNLMTVLPLIKGEYVFFLEDDDFYQPTYIEEYVYLLNKFEVVGEGNAKYYHLPTKTFQEMKNYEHASLAATGFRKSVLPVFEEALHGGDKFFDYVFWQLTKSRKLNTIIFTNKNLSVGIKGMPGRVGIGIGHTPEGYVSDPFGLKLQEWIGKENANFYSEYLGTRIKRKIQNS